MKKNHLVHAYVLSGFFVALDQLAKSFARTNPDFRWYIVKPWLGWELLLNPGIAFGIPVPNLFLIIVSPIILVILLGWFVKRGEYDILSSWGFALLMLGAISNYTDRVLYEVTVDYLRIVTSVINLADVMVVVGAGLLLWGESQRDAS